jgi:hypothetical protein
MENTVTITPHLQENYLHVDVKGMGTYENALTLWTSVVQACEEYQCFNILGEQFLLDTVSTPEAFDKNPRTRETTAFIRDVLTSRSVGYGKLFNDVDTAKRWLLGGN